MAGCIGQALYWSVFLALPLPAARGADPSSPEPAKTAAKTTTFSPEIEQKLAKFFELAGAAKRKVLAERMQGIIADIQKITGLDAEGAKALQAPAEAAIDQCLDIWTKSYAYYLRKEWAELIPSVIDLMILAPSNYLGAIRVTNEAPEDEPAWQEGLQRALNSEQAALWAKSIAARREARLAEIDALYDHFKGTMDAYFQAMMRQKTSTIEQCLDLPKTVADQLEDLAKRHAAGATKRARELNVKSLLALDDDAFRDSMKSQKVSIGLPPQEQAEEDRAWDADVATMVSEEDLRRAQQRDTSRWDRRLRAFAAVLVSEMDQRIALTAQQRKELEPLAASLVETAQVAPRDPGPRSNNISWNIPRVAVKADAGKLGAILDAQQMARWQQACKDYPKGRGIHAIANGDDGAHVARLTAEALLSPEEVEDHLSDCFQVNGASVRRDFSAEMALKVEDGVRVAGLPPDAARRLGTVAKATADECFEAWKVNAEPTIRDRIPENSDESELRAQLNRLGSFTVSFRVAAPDTLERWQRALDAELTPEQRLGWQRELDERESYRKEAIAQYLLSLLDVIVKLDREQWTKLQPRVVQMIAEYEPDLSAFFGNIEGSGFSSWYMMFYALAPMTTFSENDLQPILKKEQIDAWMKSSSYSNGCMNWSSVQMRHDRRVKQQK